MEKTGLIISFLSSRKGNGNKAFHPFNVLFRKEVSDQVRSWRFIIMLAIIALTCFGSVYTAVTNIGDAVSGEDPDNPFFFLKLFTVSDGTLPPFFVFISLLGPLLGISMGFDAVNSEHIRGTMSRILSQPVHRDYLINAKFLAAIYVISVLFFSLGFLVMGFGIIFTGLIPTPEEFMRIVMFIMISIVYVSFWLNLSILFSVKFRQPATSALAGIAVWLFFTVFYSIIVNIIANATAPDETMSDQQIIRYQEFILSLFRLLPSQLFSDVTTIFLMPNVRSLGPLTLEQVVGTVPSPLPLGQSMMVGWSQMTGLIALTVICFVLSYRSFMRREIRSR